MVRSHLDGEPGLHGVAQPGLEGIRECPGIIYHAPPQATRADGLRIGGIPLPWSQRLVELGDGDHDPPRFVRKPV